MTGRATAKPKPKAKGKPKPPPKPIITDPDVNHFGSVATMKSVRAKYSDSPRPDGGSAIVIEKRLGEEQSEQRRKRAELMDRGLDETSIEEQQQRLKHDGAQKMLSDWHRHCLSVQAHCSVMYGISISELEVLPDPNKDLPAHYSRLPLSRSPHAKPVVRASPPRAPAPAPSPSPSAVH